MARWEPGTRERLKTAALDLYDARGFDETTVADIAQAVGLTERTFFRHFSDKREVLFDRQELLQQEFVRGIEGAPGSATAIDMVTRALERAAVFFPVENRPFARQRRSVIQANPALQERELLKLAGLTVALAAALRARGVADPRATLAAETGVTVFGVAFMIWTGEGEERSLFEIEREVLGELATMTGPGEPRSHQA